MVINHLLAGMILHVFPPVAKGLFDYSSRYFSENQGLSNHTVIIMAFELLYLDLREPQHTRGAYPRPPQTPK